MDFERVRFELEDGTAFLTVDRPEVRNALDPETVKEIHRALDRIESDEAVRVVVVTGAGEKIFVAGADIKSLLTRTTRDVLHAVNNHLCSRLENFPLPTIAAINGYALGGGLEFALACDLRIASESAKLGLPETGLGIIPGAGGTQRLPRIVGLGIAKEMILTGRILEAKEALRVGLVNAVVPSGELLGAARDLAEKIKRRAPVALTLAKMAVNASGSASADVGSRFEIVAQSVLNSTRDMKEGMTAFLEKRDPAYRGE